MVTKVLNTLMLSNIESISYIHGKYYWSRMYNEITMYVKLCDICQHTKRNPNTKVPPLNPLPVTEGFSRMHVDIIGSLTKPSDKYECILVTVDSFYMDRSVSIVHTNG